MSKSVSEVSIESHGNKLFGLMTDTGLRHRPVLLLQPGLGFHSFEYRGLAERLADVGHTGVSHSTTEAMAAATVRGGLGASTISPPMR